MFPLIESSETWISACSSRFVPRSWLYRPVFDPFEVVHTRISRVGSPSSRSACCNIQNVGLFLNLQPGASVSGIRDSPIRNSFLASSSKRSKHPEPSENHVRDPFEEVLAKIVVSKSRKTEDQNVKVRTSWIIISLDGQHRSSSACSNVDSLCFQTPRHEKCDCDPLAAFRDSRTSAERGPVVASGRKRRKRASKHTRPYSSSCQHCRHYRQNAAAPSTPFPPCTNALKTYLLFDSDYPCSDPLEKVHIGTLNSP